MLVQVTVLACLEASLGVRQVGCVLPPPLSDPFGQNLNCLAIAYLHPSIPTEGKKMRQAIVSTEVLVECTY